MSASRAASLVGCVVRRRTPGDDHEFTAETVVRCAQCGRPFTVGVTYAVSAEDSARIEEAHREVEERLLRDPWSVTPDTRAHVRDCVVATVSRFGEAARDAARSARSFQVLFGGYTA